MKCTLLLSLISIFLIGGSCFSQTNSFAINAAGGSHTIGQDTYEWSVGEMTLIHTAATSDLVLTQGLLQPMLTTVGVSAVKNQDINFSVFPNPTNSKIFIKLHTEGQSDLDISVYDLRGKLLQQKTMVLTSGVEQQEFDFSPFVAGMYFMTVRSKRNGQDVVDTFKIEKIW